MSTQPDWMEVLRDAHREPIDAAHYMAVRARVLAELEAEGRARPWRRLLWAMPLLLLLLMVRVPRPDLPPLRAAVPAIPAAPAVVVRAHPDGRGSELSRARKQASVRREPLTIKIQTSDPNIVIYWIAD